MALGILSIPAIAADPERLFSSAGLTVTDRRNHLLIESIKALECIKSWVNVGRRTQSNSPSRISALLVWHLPTVAQLNRVRYSGC
jgi:hypothetical protein